MWCYGYQENILLPQDHHQVPGNVEQGQFLFYLVLGDDDSHPASQILLITAISYSNLSSAKLLSPAEDYIPAPLQKVSN